MTKNPSATWFFNDWEAEEGLVMCSLGAQGLWMRMLCLAARAEPVGHVKVNGDPCTAQDLAKYVGESNETVTELLGELERKGVFSRTRNGTIYNRRMVKRAELSRKRSESGKKGGDATASKERRKRFFASAKSQQITQQKCSKGR